MTPDLLTPFSRADVDPEVWFLEVSERVLERPFTPADERDAWPVDSDEERDR